MSPWCYWHYPHPHLPAKIPMSMPNSHPHRILKWDSSPPQETLTIHALVAAPVVLFNFSSDVSNSMEFPQARRGPKKPHVKESDSPEAEADLQLPSMNLAVDIIMMAWIAVKAWVVWGELVILIHTIVRCNRSNDGEMLRERGQHAGKGGERFHRQWKARFSGIAAKDDLKVADRNLKFWNLNGVESEFFRNLRNKYFFKINSRDSRNTDDQWRRFPGMWKNVTRIFSKTVCLAYGYRSSVR